MVDRFVLPVVTAPPALIAHATMLQTSKQCPYSGVYSSVWRKGTWQLWLTENVPAIIPPSLSRPMDNLMMDRLFLLWSNGLQRGLHFQ